MVEGNRKHSHQPSSSHAPCVRNTVRQFSQSSYQPLAITFHPNTILGGVEELAVHITK